MRLWRLSTQRYAGATDGGYGLLFEGRWNVIGRPVTYVATSPSLCVLEKLVHIEDPELLPELAMVLYAVPDTIPHTTIGLADLAGDWQLRDSGTQRMGDTWLASAETALLYVPSAIVPIAGSPDRNVLINPLHPAAASIQIERIESFTLDIRLFGA